MGDIFFLFRHLFLPRSISISVNVVLSPLIYSPKLFWIRSLATRHAAVSPRKENSWNQPQVQIATSFSSIFFVVVKIFKKKKISILLLNWLNWPDSRAIYLSTDIYYLFFISASVYQRGCRHLAVYQFYQFLPCISLLLFSSCT